MWYLKTIDYGYIDIHGKYSNKQEAIKIAKTLAERATHQKCEPRIRDNEIVFGGCGFAAIVSRKK